MCLLLSTIVARTYHTTRNRVELPNLRHCCVVADAGGPPCCSCFADVAIEFVTVALPVAICLPHTDLRL